MSTTTALNAPDEAKTAYGAPGVEPPKKAPSGSAATKVREHIHTQTY